MMRLCFLVLWVSVVGSSGVGADEKDNLDVVQVALDDAMRTASQYYYYDYQMWMTNLSFSVTNLDYHLVMKDGALHFGVLWKVKNTIAENLGVAFENVSVFLYPGNQAINVLAVVEAPESQKLKVKATPNDLGTKITTALQGIANIAAATTDHNANDVGIGLYASRHDDPQPIVTPAPTAVLTATSKTAARGSGGWNRDATDKTAWFGFPPDGSLGPGALAKFVVCPTTGGCTAATCPALLTAENALNIVVPPGTIGDEADCDKGADVAHVVCGIANTKCGACVYPRTGFLFTSDDLGGEAQASPCPKCDIAVGTLALCLQAVGKSPTLQTKGPLKCEGTNAAAEGAKDACR